MDFLHQLNPKETETQQESEFMDSSDTDEAMRMAHRFCFPSNHLQIVVWNFLLMGIITPTIFPILRLFDLQMTKKKKNNSSGEINVYWLGKCRSWTNFRYVLIQRLKWCNQDQFSHHLFILPSLLASFTVLFGSEWEICSYSPASFKVHISQRNRSPFTK